MIADARRLRPWLGAILLVCCMAGLLRADWNWPRWRGPDGTGHTAETGIPVKWDAQSVVWKTPLKGQGQSSPIVWGERIFLTTALEKGRQRVVFCVDRRDGKVLWEQVAWKGEPERSHPMNGWASASCCTDGERVVAFFGKGGLHCYDMDGKHLWSRTDLGAFAGPWGSAACPVLVGDLVVQNCDAQDKAYLLAVDRKTGKTVWQTPRETPQRGGWSTPVLVKAGDRQELVLNGEKAVAAYDPASGKQLWSCKSFIGRGEPTATPGNGLVYLVCGLRGDMYAVRPGGSGDVTQTHMAWHAPRRGDRDQPSPILVGNFLTVSSMKGTVTGYDATTGKALWKGGRIDGQFTSSPIAAGGLVYFQNDAGETYVLKPGPKMELVAKNSLGADGEVFRASLTPSDGQVFSRSDKTLYCIGQRKSAGGK